MQFRKYVKFIVLTLTAAAILWYFGRGLNWEEVIGSLKRANPTLLALATLVICFGYVLRALRWRTLLEPLSKSNLATLFETTTVGYAAVFLFGRAGEVVRPLWLPVRDPRIRPTAALVTIGVERLCDLAAIVVVFAFNLIWFRVPPGRESDFAFVNRAGLLLLACTVLGVIALAIFQRNSSRVIDWMDRTFLRRRFVPERVALQMRKILTSLSISLSILFNIREFLLTLAWTALLWFAISIPTWLVILAFGLPLDFSDALFVMGWAVVGSLAPTPAGAAGAFHTATAGALVFLGINAEIAAATSIIMHFVYFAPALFFGIYYFVRGKVSLKGIRLMVIGDSTPIVSNEVSSREAPPFGEKATDS
jgi:glycosyltransferase 2 family protein